MVLAESGVSVVVDLRLSVVVLLREFGVLDLDLGVLLGLVDTSASIAHLNI
jgi:hypothetical protein